MAVVLLVEDDDHVRVIVESYLKELGHKVLSAVTRQGAMAVLEDTPNVDLLFTDMELMGDVQAGIELARQAAERWRHLKVLYTTGGGVTEGMRARLRAAPDRKGSSSCIRRSRLLRRESRWSSTLHNR